MTSLSGVTTSLPDAGTAGSPTSTSLTLSIWGSVLSQGWGRKVRVDGGVPEAQIEWAPVLQAYPDMQDFVLYSLL